MAVDTHKIYAPANSAPVISSLIYGSESYDLGTPFLEKIGQEIWIDYEAEEDFTLAVYYDNEMTPTDSFTVASSATRTVDVFRMSVRRFRYVEIGIYSEPSLSQSLTVYGYAITYKDRPLNNVKP